MEQGKGNDHEERCLVPMEFSAVVVRKGSWEGQKTGGASASLFTLNLPLCLYVILVVQKAQGYEAASNRK